MDDEKGDLNPQPIPPRNFLSNIFYFLERLFLFFRFGFA